MDIGIVELSRLQFAMTALFHFLFVPLTLGLSVIVAIMETVYVMTNRPIWRQMTKFWGLLFGVNFAIGVATGITMEFQFGMNWSYYSHYVGDVFGAPLAIEGLMAFFMEATFVGLWFFGWEKLSKQAHLAVGWLVALGSNFSALWILIANGWMQNPVGAEFNPMTMRMEMTSFRDVLFNSVAQAKFVHTVSAGYVTAAIFVLGVSCWYLLKARHIALARRSISVASSFGLAAALSVVVLGDESGYDTGLNQKMKLAAIEAMWETEPAPASFTLIGTRSLNQVIPGIDQLEQEAEDRVRSGLIAYDALMTIQQDRDRTTSEVSAAFERHSDDLGYAFLLRRYLDDPREATEEQITQAAMDTIPPVLPIFFSFRVMVGIGLLLILTTGYFFFVSSFRGGRYPRLALRAAVLMIPLPWIAAELGWIVAEVGRQPWTVDGVLPTAMSVSALSVGEVLLTIAGFAVFYTVLLVIEVKLLLRLIQKGPQEDVDATDAWMATRRQRLMPGE